MGMEVGNNSTRPWRVAFDAVTHTFPGTLDHDDGFVMAAIRLDADSRVGTTWVQQRGSMYDMIEI